MVERTISELLRVGADGAPPLDVARTWARGRRSRKRRRVASVVGAAVVAVVASVGAVGLAGREPDVAVVSQGTLRGSPWSGRGAWVPVSTEPGPPRLAPAAVWAGNELVVWGGFRPSADATKRLQGGEPRVDGAAVDPATGRWTPIPDAPLPPLGYDVTTVWTGDDVIVWGVDQDTIGPGTTRSVGARWNPARRTWRRMAEQSSVTLGQKGTWTGSRFIVTGIGAGAEWKAAALSYDPTSDRWEELPVPPGTGADPDGVLAALDGNVLLAPAAPTGGAATLSPGALAWRLGARVTTPQVRPDHAFHSVRMAWTGDVLLQTSYNTCVSDMCESHPTALRWDPVTDAWTPAASLPPWNPTSQSSEPDAPQLGQPLGTVDHHAVWEQSDHSVLLAYHGAADRWTTLPMPPGANKGVRSAAIGTTVWSGTDLLFVVSGDQDGRAGTVLQFAPDPAPTP